MYRDALKDDLRWVDDLCEYVVRDGGDFAWRVPNDLMITSPLLCKMHKGLACFWSADSQQMIDLDVVLRCLDDLVDFCLGCKARKKEEEEGMEDKCRAGSWR